MHAGKVFKILNNLTKWHEICLLRREGEGGNYNRKDFVKKLKSYSSIVPKDLNTCNLNHKIKNLNQWKHKIVSSCWRYNSIFIVAYIGLFK